MGERGTRGDAGRAAAVLLGGRGPALSVARSLGEMGVRVHVLAGQPGPVSGSRHCHRFVAVPGGDRLQQRWLDWLEREGPAGAVLLPCEDDGLELIARHRAGLEQLGYHPIEADDDVVLAMLDKEATYRRARAVGVPSPGTVIVRRAADVERAVAERGFPCAVKPVHSHVWQRHFRAKVLPVDDELALRTTVARALELGIDVLVTEIIPGGDDQLLSYYTYIDDSGRPLFHLTKRRLRGYPVHFGLATYQVIEWHPDVAELGLRFFAGVGLRGVGNVEFKRDARDGALKLIECNHRFTAANELVRIAGVDLARIAYDRARGVDVPPTPEVRNGDRMWNVWDVPAFLGYRADGELTAAAWMRSLMHRSHVPHFRWSDPVPSVIGAAQGAGKLRRRMTRDGIRAPIARVTRAA
jgi:predicted ATP-grasp superfamily ATP-dependent carboligase